MGGRDAVRRRRKKTAVAPHARKFEDVPLLFSVSTFVSYLPDDQAETAISAAKDAEPVFENPAHNAPPERRQYKGAVYEKGEDGLWHLQHES
jgi:hypothetical protein